MNRLFLMFALIVSCAVVGMAANNCVYVTVGSSMVLQGNCTTDASIVVPNGMTHNGAGFKITAVDPASDHFRGGILVNGGSVANVVSTVLETSALANVCDAGGDRLRGVLFDGASGNIAGVTVLALNQNPAPLVLSGCQEGNALEARNFGTFAGRIKVNFADNTVMNYQKTGIICNGDADCDVTGNTVLGAGPQPYIAQNGIQVGFGATAQVKKNTVTGNAYSGTSTVSGGVLLVAGPYYGSDYSVGDQIDSNIISGNDVGVYLSNLDAFGNAPSSATNIKVINNDISNNALTNGYVYQAGISDQGNNDKMNANRISGVGYDPATLPGSTFEIDADPSFTNRPKAHGNK